MLRIFWLKEWILIQKSVNFALVSLNKAVVYLEIGEANNIRVNHNQAKYIVSILLKNTFWSANYIGSQNTCKHIII